MKGGVACMLMAVEILKEIGVTLAGDVVFTTVVDEEIGGLRCLPWSTVAIAPTPGS